MEATVWDVIGHRAETYNRASRLWAFWIEAPACNVPRERLESA